MQIFPIILIAQCCTLATVANKKRQKKKEKTRKVPLQIYEDSACKSRRKNNLNWWEMQKSQMKIFFVNSFNKSNRPGEEQEHVREQGTASRFRFLRSLNSIFEQLQTRNWQKQGKNGNLMSLKPDECCVFLFIYSSVGSLASLMMFINKTIFDSFAVSCVIASQSRGERTKTS